MPAATSCRNVPLILTFVPGPCLPLGATAQHPPGLLAPPRAVPAVAGIVWLQRDARVPNFTPCQCSPLPATGNISREIPKDDDGTTRKPQGCSFRVGLDSETQKGPKKMSSLGNTTKGVTASCSNWSHELHADKPSSLPALTPPSEAKRSPWQGKSHFLCPEPCWKVAGEEDAALQPSETRVSRDLDGSAAVLQSGRRMQQSQARRRAVNHLQAPWISACQDGRTPLAESCCIHL